MFDKKKSDVLVVGAGPVGLFAALTLAKQGVSVTVVDKDWRTGAHSYALALHARSLRLLEEMGLRDEVRERAYPVCTIGLYDSATRRAEVRITAQDESQQPVMVMPQDVLEGVLERALRRAGVAVLWNHCVSRLVAGSEGVDVTIDKMSKESVGYGVAHTEWTIDQTYDARFPYVIGADGHRSMVRRSAGIEFPEVARALHYAVFECQLSEDLGHEMRLVLGPQTTDVLWPLPNNGCRWSFELLDCVVPVNTRTKNRLHIEIGGVRFPSLDESSFRALLAERAPWFDRAVQDIRWRLVVRFEQRLATSFGRGRVWLAGDAGHLAGPAGMQSMNVGLREARELAEAIADSLGRGSSSEQLEEYSRQRTREWNCLLGLEGQVTADDHVDRWVHQCGSRIVPCIPASCGELSELARQLRLRVPLPMDASSPQTA